MQLQKKVSSILIIYLLLIALVVIPQFIQLSQKATGFGTGVVKQLKAKTITDNSNGTTITIRFQHTKPHSWIRS
ncbi:hypothetical protein BH10BAC2_BH10BAC2_17560 [soil metagenome]